MRFKIISVLWLMVQCSSEVVDGCSCPVGSPPLCDYYRSSADVYAVRVINGTCNCIPDVDYYNDELVAFYANTTNVSCVTAGRDSRGLVSETLVRASCDNYRRIYQILPCRNVLTKFADCPYEGQIFMDCAPLCPATCSNVGVASPCPTVCVRGCGCPEGMVIDEEQQRCVMPSQCPNKACPLVGQVTNLCTSSCPHDCFRPGNDSCPTLCDGCGCAPPSVADHITGKCVQPEQCTACPIEGQVYTECGSSCPRTCDNVNNIITCDAACWQGCECPSGMVIDINQRRCVEPSQCRRESPKEVNCTSRRSRYICPFNVPNSYHYPCQYTVQITEVFKGNYTVGQMITSDGPDMGTSCGSPANILSVGATYVRGIGATCGDYRAWAPYSRIPTKARQALTDGCSSVCFVTKIYGNIRHKKRRKRTKLTFSSISISTVTFKCKLDDEEFEDCKSPVEWRNLKEGRHVVTVRAFCTTDKGKIFSQVEKTFRVRVR